MGACLCAQREEEAGANYGFTARPAIVSLGDNPNEQRGNTPPHSRKHSLASEESDDCEILDFEPHHAAHGPSEHHTFGEVADDSAVHQHGHHDSIDCDDCD